MKTRHVITILLSIVAIHLNAATNPCRMVKAETERLPNLNTPRFSHSAFYVGGEVVVVGGHTSGFVPTQTAEYFSDGKWHQVNTVYTHDNGFAWIQKSGQVMIAGGHEQPMGIGQTFGVECYDPATHSFRGFGCLNKKRARATATALADGHVIISGNWYADDAVEVFDGTKHFSFVKEVSTPRTYPLMFRYAADDVLIVGAMDDKGCPIDTIVVDRLKGESLHVPLFDTWRPYTMHNECDPMRPAFIGNEDKGKYAYLFPVQNSKGQVAIARVRGTEFDLLPTDGKLPMEGKGGKIEWLTYPVADTLSQRFYLTGCDKDYRLYVARIDYSQSPAPVTIYYTGPKFLSARTRPVLTEEGDLIFAGGIYDDHFEPHATAYVVHIGERGRFSETASWWCWTLCILAILAVMAIIIIVIRLQRRRKSIPTAETSAPSDAETGKKLLEKIDEIVKNEQLYLNPDLKLGDVAARVGTNSRYISDSINAIKGCTFSQYLNSIRVEHAKQLMLASPDEKVVNLYVKSGFANERTFFRVFKATTGLSPKEWITSKTGR